MKQRNRFHEPSCLPQVSAYNAKMKQASAIIRASSVGLLGLVSEADEGEALGTVMFAIAVWCFYRLETHNWFPLPLPGPCCLQHIGEGMPNNMSWKLAGPHRKVTLTISWL